MNQKMKAFLLLLLLCLMGAGAAVADPPSAAAELQTKLNLEGFRLFATQQGGRLKPFDTFARETVRLVTGQEQFEGADPVATMLYWWAHGSDNATPHTSDLLVIELRNLEFKKELGLPAEQRWFSLKDLATRPELMRYEEEIAKLPPNGKIPKKLSTAQDLLVKMRYLNAVSTGQVINIIPNPQQLDGLWTSVAEFASKGGPGSDLVAPLRQSVLDEDGAKFSDLSAHMSEAVQMIGPYPALSALTQETYFNQFHPFRKAWILYFITLVCLFLASGSKGPLYWIGMSTACFGFALHAYGFYLRCVIAGRPPVTNMYESVIWVAFAAVLFSLIFEFVYRARSYLMASTACAVVCLILADNLPTVLDPSIRPLTPVLRSNFWLTIHVLTITAGYAAFMLSLGLGHMVLWKYVAGPDQKETLRGLNKALYKAIQVGVLLLAAGTILGGVWASYSWGRFWGWDPKEVWALIALLGYLSILHGRYAGWLGNFGTAAASVLAFQGVLMAWYGVNFVLGAGLHSYGFGDGGVQYVGCFSLTEVLLVAAAIWRHRAHQQASEFPVQDSDA